MVGVITRNPFNGIERALGRAGASTGTDTANPFNGIESATHNDPSPPGRPIESIQWN